MAGLNLGFPYDEEIFNYQWKNTPDLVLTSMIESGAVVRDAEIERLIANGSNYFTTPYYDVLGGDEDVYNGVNDFTDSTLSGGNYSGVVYGRMKKWSAKSFIKDFNSGADPMAQIVDGVAQYWIKARQVRLIKILEAVFGVNDTDFATHITDLATANGTVNESNLIGVTTINDATVKACGDNAHGFSLVIMHSVVANRLANLQLLEFSKYTDKAGLTRNLPIATVNGMTVIVNDNVPVDKKISYVKTEDEAIDTDKTYYTVNAKGEYTEVDSPKLADIESYYEQVDLPDEYTTYVLGLGSIRFASAPVDTPSEMERDPNKNGGLDMIYTRVRECIAPYGFSFKGDVTTDVGVPDTVLTASASWERKMPAKSILMAKIVTNG